ncbi:hypothetical protein BESB_038820 [Besnoitia besnoiti]|uniref:Transmembrane protein n=1 Tax=Besnoitia besnoiti TaxID=94643 RepID=A0A2A9MJR6_BESBE|nr:hypothetical protein BESB_038820 [Besnoitia besnoiti]PFH37424.1 hypothetical protein BESB_038820 [Besnoitia besnoiti]
MQLTQLFRFHLAALLLQYAATCQFSILSHIVRDMESFARQEPNVLEFVRKNSETLDKRLLQSALIYYTKKHGPPQIRPGVKHTVASLYRDARTLLRISAEELEALKATLAHQLAEAAAQRDRELRQKQQDIRQAYQRRKTISSLVKRWRQPPGQRGSPESWSDENSDKTSRSSNLSLHLDPIEEAEDETPSEYDVPDTLNPASVSDFASGNDEDNNSSNSSTKSDDNQSTVSGGAQGASGRSSARLPETSLTQLDDARSSFSKAWGAVRSHRKGIAIGVAAIALAAGLVAAHKKMKPWKGISGSGAYSWDVATCSLLLKFDLSRRLKAMGTVVDIIRVAANNFEGELEVTYKEKPAFASSRGKELVFPLAFYLSLGFATTTRKETFVIPPNCVASRSSTFVVSRNGAAVEEAIVDLDYRPASFAVPREVVDSKKVESFLQSMSDSDNHWTLYPQCILHLAIRSDALQGSPIVLVDSARGIVALGNRAMEDEVFVVPPECQARTPNDVKYLSLERTIDDARYIDIVLVLEEVDGSANQTWTEIRNGADVDPEKVLASRLAVAAEGA